MFTDYYYYISFKHKIYITAYDIIGREENLSRCLVLLPIAVSWKFEFENDATGSKYQKIIWNRYHLFVDFEPKLNSKLKLLPFELLYKRRVKNTLLRNTTAQKSEVLASDDRCIATATPEKRITPRCSDAQLQEKKMHNGNLELASTLRFQVWSQDRSISITQFTWNEASRAPAQAY